MTGSVLMLTSTYPRWADDSTTTFVADLATSLVALGWSVDVVAPHDAGAVRHEQLDGVTVHRFRYAWPERSQTLCYGGGGLIRLRQRRANVLKLPQFVVAEWGAAVSRVMRRRYDVIHSHWLVPQGFVGALVPTRARHVVTVHGGDVFALQQRPVLAAKAFTLRHADCVTFNSSVSRRAALALGACPRREELIPMGVRTPTPDPATVEQFRADHRLDGGPLVVLLGRIVEEKGVPDAIAAMRSVLTECPDARLVIAGDGPDVDSARVLADQLGLGDRVRLIGWVPKEDVPSLLAAADIVVAPSRTSDQGWQEAQGLSILEAMASGVPVVASRSGGIVDSIEDGRTGLLVPERSPSELADAIVRLHHEPELSRRIGAAGADEVGRRFSLNRTASSFSALFTSLL